ncbi:MAG TPA: 50S ribosomal protein L35 [Chlamydiales bacterium]|nr:50S ribosomal protein L35 [Chlamydiales bacterium]
MPKMKTKKAVQSRFKSTGTGKLKRTRPNRSHILTKKTSKRKRYLKSAALVPESHERTYKKVMGIA